MSSLSIDTTAPVLVTGGTGYVAGHLIKHLLAEGLTVHATVRDPSRTERLQYLRDLAAGTPGTLRFFQADLLEAGSFDAAMAGCRVVFHVASPYTMDIKDAQTELVDPAVNGTTTVLDSANRTASVERVVLTSSMAAIFGASADLAETPRGVFDEAVWNTSSSLTDNPYSYSKTLAEKKAWEMHDAQDRWRLVVMNPPGIFGPGVKVHEGAESFKQLAGFGDGTLKAGAPDLRIGLTDVRDVAEAHVRAAFLPEASGRYVISGHDSGFLEIAQILRGAFPQAPVPKSAAPKWLLWLVGPLVNKAITRSFVSKNIGLDWKADNSKSVRELGMRYRPLEQTFTEHFQQLADAGMDQA